MTTEEKLQHFLDTCMEDARTRSNRMLDEYMNALEETFKQHQADAKRRSAMQIEQETEKIEREINKKLAVEQIDIRRALGQKQEELKDKLFVELRDQLANFLETPEYLKLLENRLQMPSNLPLMTRSRSTLIRSMRTNRNGFLFIMDTHRSRSANSLSVVAHAQSFRHAIS